MEVENQRKFYYRRNRVKRIDRDMNNKDIVYVTKFILVNNK
jgi:hypothetical protein